MNKKYRSKAPLRLGLAGGGTDINTYCDKHGGYVLNTTISLYVHCTIEILSTSIIIFEALDMNESLKLKSESFLDLNNNMDLYKGVYNRLLKDFNLEPLSFKLTTYSDVPSGSGLGGSSTLVVAMLHTYIEWLNLPLGEYDIAKLAYEIEREDIGIIGGFQDQYSSTFGGFNFMEFYADKKAIINPLRIKSWILDELEDSIVLYFTNIQREASQLENEKKSLLTNKSSLDAMHEVKADSLLMKEALLKGEISKFSDILGKSWKAKKRVSKSVTNNEIDRIYDLAIECGAYSGKVSGAGGGGFMFFMIEPTKKLYLIKELNKEQGRVVNFEFTKYGTKTWSIENNG
jgi:D-glycero-alpha-D-manno-heptose-7-phosphate kinase